MDLPAEGFVFWATVVLGLLGGASVIAALRCRDSASGVHFQRLFIFCLVSTGAATIIALSFHNNCWLSCAVSCASLSIGATFDTGRPAAREAISL